MIVKASPRQVLTSLLVVIGALTVGKLGLTVLQYVLDPAPVPSALRILDTNLEQGLGTLFSSLQLALAALTSALLGLHARQHAGAGLPPGRPTATTVPVHRADVRAWLALAGVFVLLAIDESCALHELLNEPVRDRLHLGGALYFAWVLPAVIAVVVVVAAFARFWWRQDAHTRILLAVAAVTFVSGAIGLEMRGAALWAAGDARTLPYRLSTGAEEFLEMVGVAVYVYATWRLLAERVGCIELGLAGADTAAAAGDRRSASNGERPVRAWRDPVPARKLPAPEAGG